MEKQSHTHTHTHTHTHAHTPMHIHTHWKRSCTDLAALHLNIFKDERRRETICLHVLPSHAGGVSACEQRSRPGIGLKKCEAVYVLSGELVVVSLASHTGMVQVKETAGSFWLQASSYSQ